MVAASQHSRPALHNAMWPGLVGKGGPDAEPGFATSWRGITISVERW
jgi:hypothetical protein